MTERARQEMRSIVLLEVEVRGAVEPPDISRWHQRRLRYAPYDEVYFALDRRRVLCRALERPAVPDFAVAFYLHFFDPRRALITDYGALDVLKPVWERPTHLADRVYWYWD